MPFGTQTQWRREALPRPEILSYPLETTVIDSVVVNATGVTPDPSTSPYWNRRYLVAGTILTSMSSTRRLPARLWREFCLTLWNSLTIQALAMNRWQCCDVTFRSRRIKLSISLRISQRLKLRWILASSSRG